VRPRQGVRAGRGAAPDRAGAGRLCGACTRAAGLGRPGPPGAPAVQQGIGLHGESDQLGARQVVGRVGELGGVDLGGRERQQARGARERRVEVVHWGRPVARRRRGCACGKPGAGPRRGPGAERLARSPHPAHQPPRAWHSHPSSGPNCAFSAARLAPSISASPCQKSSTGSVEFRPRRSWCSRTAAWGGAGRSAAAQRVSEPAVRGLAGVAGEGLRRWPDRISGPAQKRARRRGAGQGVALASSALKPFDDQPVRWTNCAAAQGPQAHLGKVVLPASADDDAAAALLLRAQCTSLKPARAWQSAGGGQWAVGAGAACECPSVISPPAPSKPRCAA
jgi:hypothetical protein